MNPYLKRGYVPIALNPSKTRTSDQLSSLVPLLQLRAGPVVQEMSAQLCEMIPKTQKCEHLHTIQNRVLLC